VTSGKQTKRRVQAPKARQPARPERRASRKVIIAAAAVLVLAAIGIGLGVAFTGGSGSSIGTVPLRGSLTGKLALPEAAVVHTLLKGIPQRGNGLGKTTAPVTMVEYIDLQCPFCDAFELKVFPDLVSRYVRPGTLRIQQIPLGFIGPDSQRGRLAAIAAAKQNRMFDFSEILYANQGTENTGWLNDKMVTRAAASIPGLAVRRLLAVRKLPATARIANSFDQSANTVGVSRTPTILVGKTGGAPLQVTLKSPTDEASVAAAIDRVLNSG
jgi:protein-disulfide isomerase